MEDVAEAGCEDGGGGGVEFVFALWAAHVYEIHFQSERVSWLDVGLERGGEAGRVRYRNEPSVLTLRSWRMNQTPIRFSQSVNLKALTQRLPIKFRVNMPLGWERGSQATEGESKGPCPGPPSCCP